MKKLGFLLVVSVLLSGVAHADFSDCAFGFNNDYADAHPVECFFGESTFMPTLFSMMSSSMGLKEAYVGQVRDDAAQYVAENGQEAATAVLQEAIQTIRANDARAANLTDLQIARDLTR